MQKLFRYKRRIQYLNDIELAFLSATWSTI